VIPVTAAAKTGRYIGFSMRCDESLRETSNRHQRSKDAAKAKARDYVLTARLSQIARLEEKKSKLIADGGR